LRGRGGYPWITIGAPVGLDVLEPMVLVVNVRVSCVVREVGS
jgi:hypothetical protein